MIQKRSFSKRKFVVTSGLVGTATLAGCSDGADDENGASTENGDTGADDTDTNDDNGTVGGPEDENGDESDDNGDSASGNYEEDEDVTVSGEESSDISMGGFVTLEDDAKVNGSIIAGGDVTLGIDAEVDDSIKSEGSVTLEENAEVDDDIPSAVMSISPLIQTLTEILLDPVSMWMTQPTSTVISTKRVEYDSKTLFLAPNRGKMAIVLDCITVPVEIRSVRLRSSCLDELR